MKLKNITVVIRSCDERTEQFCYNLVLKEVSKENVFIIREKPFRKAIIKNFNIGINEGLKYTLALDADIILKENTITEMVSEFEKLPENYFLYQGCIFDKFFNKYRSGGPHLYKTKFLKDLINFIPKDGESLRPESDSFFNLINKGFHYFNDNKFYGLHDFEQNDFDIYRKFFLYAKKYTSSIPSLLIRFKKILSTDQDYQMATRGLVDGMLFKGNVFIDIDFFREKYNTLSVLKCHEKSSFIDEKLVEDIFIKIKNSNIKTLPIRDSSKKIKKQSVLTRIIKRIVMKIHIKSEEFLY